MDKRGGLFTHVKEQVLWIYRVVFLVIFSLVVLVAVSRILVYNVETENSKLDTDIIAVQQCLESLQVSDFSVSRFQNCFSLRDVGIKLSIPGKTLFQNDFFQYNRDFCDFGYVCKTGYYVLEKEMVSIEVLIKDE